MLDFSIVNLQHITVAITNHSESLSKNRTNSWHDTSKTQLWTTK